MKTGDLVFVPPQADNSGDATGETARLVKDIITGAPKVPPVTLEITTVMDAIQGAANQLALFPQDNIPMQIAMLRLQEAHLYLAVLAERP